jgi:hypothetical protein
MTDIQMLLELAESEKALRTRVASLKAALAEARDHGEQYRQNWLALQKATGEDCQLRALEVIAEAREDSARINYVESLGDIGLVALDNDLEGVHIQIVWNRFNIAGVPSTLRTAIDAARKP